MLSFLTKLITITFLITSTLIYQLIFSQEVLSQSRKGNAVSCLRASKNVVKHCSSVNNNFQNTVPSRKILIECKNAKKTKSTTCNKKSLKCNLYDSKVCGVFLGKDKTFKNICTLRKSSAEFKHEGKCRGENFSTNNQCISTTSSIPVCGKKKNSCKDLKRCPSVDSIPSWFPNKCELQREKSVEVSPIDCDVENCPTQEVVCGEQIFSCVGGVCELNVAKKTPRLLINRCALIQGNYSELPLQACIE